MGRGGAGSPAQPGLPASSVAPRPGPISDTPSPCPHRQNRCWGAVQGREVGPLSLLAAGPRRPPHALQSTSAQQVISPYSVERL